MRARPIAIAAGLVAAFYMFALVAIRGVPDAALALLGGPHGGVARHGGLVLRYRPPAGTDIPGFLARARARDLPIRQDGDLLVLEVPGATQDEAADLIAIVTSGGLEFHEDLEDTSLLRVPVLATGPKHAEYVADGVIREIDMWRPEDDGSRHTVPYLWAYSRDALDRGIAQLEAQGWTPPPHSFIAYERVDPYPGAKDPRPFWRTHLLADEVLLDGDAIAGVTGSMDPNTNRPVVLLEFTRAAATRFGEITERITGKKLATVIGGQVESAPIINGPIRGGRAQITMGGADETHQLAEQKLMIKALRTMALPRGGEIVERTWQHPPDLGRLLLIAQLALALAAGLLAGGALWLAIRLTRPAWRPGPARASGPLPLPLIAATLLAPFALIMLGDLPLPFVNDVELNHVITRSHDFPLNPGLAGIEPLITGFILVELATLVVPRLYRRRHDPRLRITLGKAAAAVGIALALLKGYVIGSYISSLSAYGAEVVAAPPGWKISLFLGVTIAAGTALLAVTAGMIREHVLGNGYGALLATTWLFSVNRRLIDTPSSSDAVAIVALLAIAAATWLLLRMRVGEPNEAPLRVPTSGSVPLSDASGLLQIVGAFFTLGWIARIDWLDRWSAAARHLGWITVLVAAGLAIVWSFAFARPAITAPLAARAQLAPTSVRSWRRATVLSAVVIAAIAAIEAVTKTAGGEAALLCDASMVMLATAVVLDIVDEVRARRTPLVAIWPLHQPQYAEVVAHALRDAGIPFHMKGSHLRALLAFFGPYVPIDVMVPAAQAAEARTKIAWLFEETHLAAFE